MDAAYDVVVIGGGVVGCALARDLSRYRVRVALLERRSDVGEGTSKANSAIVHTGFDARPGTLESRLVAEGWSRFQREAEPLRIPLKRCGAVLVAFGEDEEARLVDLQAEARENGVADVELVGKNRLREAFPHVNPAASAALWIPGESITCPFTAVYAFAENAAANGVDIWVETPVIGMTRSGGRWHLETPKGVFKAELVINAAGLWSDEVAALRTGSPPFRVTPRKGEFIILDREASRLVPTIVLPMPTPRTKGILVAPTIFGNVLMGPTAVDVEAKDDLGVTETGLEAVRKGAYRLVPALEGQPEICTYAGLRATGPSSDYFISVDAGEGVVDIAGVRSTGLTAALGIARYVVGRLQEAGFALPPKAREAVQEGRPPDRWPGWYRPPYLDPARLAANPGYGRIVCFCETVSEQEIKDAAAHCFGPATVDAIKRRTRATAGRCQGFNCLGPLIRLLGEINQQPLESVRKADEGSYWTAPAAGKGTGRNG